MIHSELISENSNLEKSKILTFHIGNCWSKFLLFLFQKLVQSEVSKFYLVYITLGQFLALFSILASVFTLGPHKLPIFEDPVFDHFSWARTLKGQNAEIEGVRSQPESNHFVSKLTYKEFTPRSPSKIILS